MRSTFVRTSNYHGRVGKKAKARAREREQRKSSDAITDGDGTVPTDLDRLATRLNSVAIHLLRRLSREDSVGDLTPARLSALTTLTANGPLTLGSLAHRERVTAPSMTRLTSAMQADGLVERIPSAQDGRMVYLRATEAGLQQVRSGRERRVAGLKGWLGPVDADGLRCLDRATELLESVFRDEPD